MSGLVTIVPARDAFISVNGVRYALRRGVETRVPPSVVELLENGKRLEPQGGRKPSATTGGGAAGA